MECVVCFAPAVAIVNYAPTPAWERLVPQGIFANHVYGICGDHSAADVTVVVERQLLRLIGSYTEA